MQYLIFEFDLKMMTMRIHVTSLAVTNDEREYSVTSLLSNKSFKSFCSSKVDFVSKNFADGHPFLPSIPTIFFSFLK